jgi:flagellar biosynthesis/type III secretory pathway M-ring protein FliF/YscJ
MSITDYISKNPSIALIIIILLIIIIIYLYIFKPEQFTGNKKQRKSKSKEDNEDKENKDSKDNKDKENKEELVNIEKLPTVIKNNIRKMAEAIPTTKTNYPDIDIITLIKDINQNS